MINLQQEPIFDPLVRIQVMEQGHWTDSTQPWVDMPMAARLDSLGVRYWGNINGVELDSVERTCLPDVGSAVFHMEFGYINGGQYDTGNVGEADTAWGLIKNGAGMDVRISIAEPPQGDSTGFTPTWKTIFIGTVVAQEDSPFAGSGEAGRRTWRCSDLLWRTSRWPMNRHNNYNGTFDIHCEGHPGYNFAVQGYYRRVIGNLDADNNYYDPYGDLGGLDVHYKAHTFAGIGAAATWTDLQVVNHALVCSRARGEPVLEVTGATSLLDLARFVWPVNDAEPCWDFINRVLARQRGRGLSFLDWTEDVGAPFNVKPKITVTAQSYDDITANPPGGSPVVFPGANSNGTSKDVDLTGDQRVVDGGISISKNDTGTCDYLESEGEPLEILVTLSPGDDGTLAKRWNASDEAAFAALPSGKTWLFNSSRWQYVWQRWGIPTDFDWTVKDGNNGATSGSAGGHSINWFCNDLGNLQLAATGTPVPSQTNSKTVTRIMSDLPLYEGYDYTANSLTRYDGAAQNAELYAPPRLRPLILRNFNRGNAAATYVDSVTADGSGLANDDFGVLIISGDASIGQRPFSGVGGPAAGQFAPEALTLTVGLQLSNRVRMASAQTDPTTALPYVREKAPRRRSLRFPGIFLWLADPSAIWSIYDATINANNQTPKRNAAGGTVSSDGLTIVPGIIRDDRSKLAQLHALAWSWYSSPRSTGQWQIRGCGLFDDFPLEPSGSAPYPPIGAVVHHLTSSVDYFPNTPITRIRWDVASGVTTWVLDWNELDLNT